MQPSLPLPSAFRQSLGAIAFACMGWFLFCVYDAIVKFLSASLPILQIAGTVATIGMCLSGGWIFLRYGFDGFKTQHLKLYLARGLSLVVAGYLVLSALSRIPLADFYGIIFLTPMMTTILAVFFLKEKIGWHRIMAIVIGFTGVLIVAGPSFQNGNIGYVFALSAVLFTSTNAILLRKIGQETIKARFAFFPFFVSTLVFVPLMIPDFERPDNILGVVLLLLAPVISVVGVVLFSIGFSRARDTAVITPFHYTQMIWGALLGFIIFGDVPAVTTITGSLVIVAAGIMVIWREHVHHKTIVTDTAPPAL
jgi:drug/metabolite transporter (DMT)-like permease